jgi:two-component system, OmpR family, response regulator
MDARPASASARTPTAAGTGGTARTTAAAGAGDAVPTPAAPGSAPHTGPWSGTGVPAVAGRAPGAGTPPVATVLVVEDEPGIADILRITLRYNGFAVHSAATGREALAAARRHRPDLILLDVMLPDGNGWEVCRALRAEREAEAGGPDGDELAIIFVTARDAPRDVVAGLALGGDDYITKPFGVDEVVARVHAVLRRTRRRTGRAGQVLAHGDLEMDEATYTVRRGGSPVELTPTEYNLLRHLLRHAGRILTKEQLLHSVWQFDTAVSSTVVETYISYLRRKLDRLGPPLIETRRGVGYGLRPIGTRPAPVPPQRDAAGPTPPAGTTAPTPPTPPPGPAGSTPAPGPGATVEAAGPAGPTAPTGTAGSAGGAGPATPTESAAPTGPAGPAGPDGPAERDARTPDAAP